MFNNVANQPYKFWTKHWVEINNDARETYSTETQINTSIIRWSLCCYSYAYILMKRTISITGEGADAAASQRDERYN